MIYEGENTLRSFNENKLEELEKRLDGFPGKLCEDSRTLLKMTDAEVKFHHVRDAMSQFYDNETKTKKTVDKPPKFEKQRLILLSDCIIFTSKKKLAGVSTRNLAYRGRIFVHEMRLRNAPPGTENRDRTLMYMRQTVEGVDTYTVIFASPSDKEEWWMGLDDVINVAKRQMSFGLKLHELMTINKHEFGRDVPSLLTNCIAFIEQHGLDVEGLYRISGSSADIESYRNQLNKGAEFQFKSPSDVHLVSGLLKLWLRDLREPLCTSGMFNEFIGTVTDEAEVKPDTIENLKRLIGMLPQYERFALHELMMHLSKVASHASTNNMKADNLAIVIGPNILKSPDPLTQASGVPNTFKKVFKVIEVMIAHCTQVFDGIDEQRRALLEAAQAESAKERAQFRSVRQIVSEGRPRSFGERDDDVCAESPKDGVKLLQAWRTVAQQCHLAPHAETALRSVLARANATKSECAALSTALTAIAGCTAPSIEKASTSDAALVGLTMPRTRKSQQNLFAIGNHKLERHRSETTSGLSPASSSPSSPSRGPPPVAARKLKRNASATAHTTSMSHRERGLPRDWNVRAPAAPGTPPRRTKPNALSSSPPPTPKSRAPPVSVPPEPVDANITPPPEPSSPAATKKLTTTATSPVKSPLTQSSPEVPTPDLDHDDSSEPSPPPDDDDDDDDDEEPSPPAVSSRDFVKLNQQAAAKQLNTTQSNKNNNSNNNSNNSNTDDASKSSKNSSKNSFVDDDDELTSEDDDPPPPPAGEMPPAPPAIATPSEPTVSSLNSKFKNAPPPSKSPPPRPSTGTKTGDKLAKSDSTREKKPKKLCEECNVEKARHRITLKSGSKKLVCPGCMSQFASVVKK